MIYGMLNKYMELDNMEELKEIRTKYLKAYNNCYVLDGQSAEEFLKMRANFYSMYAEADRLIKKIQRQPAKGVK